MQAILHKASDSGTPEIYFDAEKGYFEIKGDSYPNDAEAFYAPLLQWLEHFVEQYNADKQPTITFHLQLKFFNSSTAKYILEILKRLKEITNKGGKLSVQWYYDEDDPDNYQFAQDCKDLLQIPSFELISFNDNSEEEALW